MDSSRSIGYRTMGSGTRVLVIRVAFVGGKNLGKISSTYNRRPQIEEKIGENVARLILAV